MSTVTRAVSPRARHRWKRPHAKQRATMSIRALTVAALVTVGLLVLTVTASLWATASLVTPSIHTVERDTAALALADEVERTVREHQRLSDVWVASRDDGADRLHAALEDEVESRLRTAAMHAEGSAERRMLSKLAADLAAYFDAGRSLEARGAPLSQLIVGTRPYLEQALTSSASLRRYYDAQRRRTQDAVVTRARLADGLSFGSVVVLLLGSIVVAVGTRSLVLRPILLLRDAMGRFREDGTEVRVPAARVRELDELGGTFGEMVDTIARQRRDQLTYLAGVAHDLRNPLAGLKLVVESLARDPASATPASYRRLDRQLDRLDRMVGDLLDATRIAAGHLELRPQVIDLRDSVRAMVELYALTTTTHPVVLQLPHTPVAVCADPLRIEQVVSNLLSNAIKYSPQGGSIEVEVASGDAEAIVSVTDHGVGISPEEVPGLFQPFRRRPATGAVPGVGLGLSIVRSIVSAHGGAIDVDSRLGRGSTFRVRLPSVALSGELGRPCASEPRPAGG